MLKRRAWDTRKAYFRRTWQRRPSSALQENTAARCAYKKARRRMHGMHVPPDIEAKAPRFAKSAQDRAPAKLTSAELGRDGPALRYKKTRRHGAHTRKHGGECMVRMCRPTLRQKPHASLRALRIGHPQRQRQNGLVNPPLQRRKQPRRYEGKNPTLRQERSGWGTRHYRQRRIATGP